MTLRRPNRPNAKQPALQQPIMLDGGTATVQANGAEAASGMKDFLKQLDAALQEDPSLDRDARDDLMQQVQDAMSATAAVGANAAPFDRSVWMDAVQSLQSSGAMGENEANELIRQINQALQPLQRRESQLAIEFSRRLQTEGEEKALAWFRKEAAGTAHAVDAQRMSQPSPSADNISPLRSEVVNSRSRRLRGPPGPR